MRCHILASGSYRRYIIDLGIKPDNVKLDMLGCAKKAIVEKENTTQKARAPRYPHLDK
jgi:hypothetical protein